MGYQNFCNSIGEKLINFYSSENWPFIQNSYDILQKDNEPNREYHFN